MQQWMCQNSERKSPCQKLGGERVKQIMLWTITLTLGTVDLPYYFQVEVSDDLMLLTYERCCMLQCQKVGLK